MQIPKRAIEKAIEGGWDTHGGWKHFVETLGGWRFYDDEPYSPAVAGITFHPKEISLDRSFWQALGKALGWEKYTYVANSTPEIGVPKRYRQKAGDWHKEAMRFYDLILTDGDTKKFWDELIQ